MSKFPILILASLVVSSAALAGERGKASYYAESLDGNPTATFTRIKPFPSKRTSP